MHPFQLCKFRSGQIVAFQAAGWSFRRIATQVGRAAPADADFNGHVNILTPLADVLDIQSTYVLRGRRTVREEVAHRTASTEQIRVFV